MHTQERPCPREERQGESGEAEREERRRDSREEGGRAPEKKGGGAEQEGPASRAGVPIEEARRHPKVEVRLLRASGRQAREHLSPALTACPCVCVCVCVFTAFSHGAHVCRWELSVPVQWYLAVHRGKALSFKGGDSGSTHLYTDPDEEGLAVLLEIGRRVPQHRPEKTQDVAMSPCMSRSAV